MAFISLTPNMMVEDVKETISYYRDKLGFTLLRTIPEQGKPDWAMMKRSEVQLMFQSRKSLGSELPQMQGRKPGGGLTLYIKVQELEELFESLEDEVEVISPLEYTFYDTSEFSIMDMNGYVITFSESNTEKE